jgi:hypothetical protein
MIRCCDPSFIWFTWPKGLLLDMPGLPNLLGPDVRLNHMLLQLSSQLGVSKFVFLCMCRLLMTPMSLCWLPAGALHLGCSLNGNCVT